MENPQLTAYILVSLLITRLISLTTMYLNKGDYRFALIIPGLLASFDARFGCILHEAKQPGRSIFCTLNSLYTYMYFAV